MHFNYSIYEIIMTDRYLSTTPAPLQSIADWSKVVYLNEVLFLFLKRSNLKWPAHPSQSPLQQALSIFLKAVTFQNQPATVW